MNYRIQWTTNAYLDFSQIVNFIKESWGKRSAEDFINNVDAIMSLLIIFPQLGKILHPSKQIRALIISKQTTVVYRIKDYAIIILNFFDNRQDPDKLIVNESTSVTYGKQANSR